MDYRNSSLDLLVREINGIFYTEEFKPINECPDYYVSTFGRVKKLGYKSRDIKKPEKFIPDKIIKGKRDLKGYIRVRLRINGKVKNRYAHRLVALSFIPNPYNKPDVNHITGIKTDNHVSQLEWCTPQENNEHGVRMGLLKRGRAPYVNRYIKKGRPLGWKKIININTGEIFANSKQLHSKTGIPIKEIRRQLNGERYCHLPYRYLGQEDKVKLPPQPKPKEEKPPKKERPPRKVYVPHPKVLKKILQFDLNGNMVRLWDSVNEAAMAVNSKPTTFRKAIKKSPENFTKGYIWKYA